MTARRTSRLTAVTAAVVLLVGCGGAADVADEPTKTDVTTEVTDPPTPPPTTPTAQGDLPVGFGAGPDGSGIERFYDQEVSWSDCEQGECADIWVPLDYDDPDGQAITVKAARQPASDQANKQGSLLINPGGPGGSGVEYLGYIGLDSSITQQFDVIGFDPRGVATSTPVDCISDEQLDAYVASDPTPDTEAEVQEFEDLWATLTEGCVERSGPLLEHVSTVEVARDMDVIRGVVGDEKLTFFGASYGTYIGATYASLFPDKVGRLVLDGAVDPKAEPRANSINQAAGFDVALTAYLEDCVSQGDCPLGDSVDGARERLIQLFADIDQSPLPTSSDRELTEGLAFLGVIVPLYSRDSWSYLTQALGEAVDGNGDTLLFLADTYTERQDDGTYPTNSMEVQSAVNCLDKPEDATLDEIEAGGDDFIAKAPVFGQAAMWWPYACSNWPATSTEEKPDFVAAGAAPILVVGTTRDPATPYQQAVKLAKELDSGVLLSRDGDGHTAYGKGNECIDEAINTYLIEGTPPDDGTEC